jgi:NADH:ubiquinone oxidoreductase subunit 6 (subunit J)
VNQSGRRFAGGAAVLFCGLAVALFLVIAGAVFGLNGEQWAWWALASWLGALMVLVGAAVKSLQLAASGSGSDNQVGAIGALFGIALLIGCLWLMSRRYSDPYSGDLFWPHALAVLAFVGLAVAVVALLLGGRRERSNAQ